MKTNFKILSTVLAVLTAVSIFGCISAFAAPEYNSGFKAVVITAENGKASLDDAAEIASAVSTRGDIAVVVNADGENLEFDISVKAMNEISEVGLKLDIYAKSVKLTLSPKTLAEIASKATETAKITIKNGDTLDVEITSGGKIIELAERANVAVTEENDAGSIVTENGERMAFSYADTEKWGFKLDGSAKVSVKKMENITFADTESHWSKENVAFAAANGYFNGVGDNKFAPDNKMTRAMAVTVLSRIDGFTGEAGELPFTDVPKNEWYTKAVGWALANEIISADNGANFRPNDDITRVELMSMMYNFALKLGITSEGEYADKVLGFSDADQIEDADINAVLFCTETGIITGYTSNRGTKTIKAAGKATRAEVATMMQRFVKYSVLKGSENMATGKYAEAMQKRGDLLNVYNKLKNDKELTVAYFGGSVTAGAGASNSNTTSWRGLINTWFKTNFPDANITMIHAAVGGSGSHLGAFRVQENIIPKKPDLVFTEFVVNDHYSGTVGDGKVEMYYESIIRQIREALPETEVIAIYVTNQGAYTSSNLAGKYIQAAASQEKVCEAYGITSIDVGRAMAIELGEELQPVWNQYFTDSVHPADKGYAFYAGVIEEYLNEYLFGAPSLSYGEKRTYTNPDTYVDKRNETFKPIYVSIKSLDVFDEIEGWTFDRSTYLGNDGSIIPNSADNKLVLTFEGTDIDLFTDISGGYRYTYSIDGGEEKNGRITGSNHPAKFLKNLGEGKHTLTFTNTGDSGDGVFEKNRHLMGFLIHGTK